jgi:hypothetical protein
MPRASPAFPCPASKINRFGPKKLSPIEVTTCAAARAAASYRRLLVTHDCATNFTETPLPVLSEARPLQYSPYVVSARRGNGRCESRPLKFSEIHHGRARRPDSAKTRIEFAASAAATVSAASGPAGSRSCTQTTPRSPPSASCPLPAPARTNPCSNGACACRNPSGPE